MNQRNLAEAFDGAKEYVDAFLFEAPNPFEKLDDKARKEIAQKVGAKAKQDFEDSMGEIKDLIRQCNPFQALAHLGYYDGTLLDCLSSMKKKEDDRSAYKPVLQFSIEFFQALFLATPTEELKVHITPVEVLLKINKVLHKLGESYMLLGMGEDDSISINRHIRHHTFAVRNAGFHNQVIEQLKGLFSPLDKEFYERTGVELSALVVMWENLHKRYGNRINDDLGKMRDRFKLGKAEEIIKAYCDEENLDAETMDMLFRRFTSSDGSLEAARVICLNNYELSLNKFYHYELKDFVDCYPKNVEPEKLNQILREWSISIEELVGQNLERFLLDNPIWKRPIISHPDIEWFYWPMLQIFHSFGMEMLEFLLHKYPDLEKTYQSKIRGEYLEGQVRAMFQDAFKGYAVHQNLEWRSEDSGRSYETDILLLADDVALVVECKAGKITPPARRGAPDRVRKEIKKLIEEASEQSLRLARRLREAGDLRMKPHSGSMVVVQPSSVKMVVRLTVTLDFFGPLACDVRTMLDSGLLSVEVASAPTISLVDLDLITHLLPFRAQLLHYFIRREQIEKKLGLVGDESDLLALYLATGFNVGEVEFESKRHIQFANLGGQLEPYMYAKSAGVTVTKPRPKLTEKWSRLLSAFEERRFKGWIRASLVLLSVDFEAQKAFEKHEREMLFRIGSTSPHEDELNVVASVHGPAMRRTGVLAIGVRTKNRDERLRIIQNALGNFIERESVEEIVFLCHYVYDLSLPYVVAGLHSSKEQ